MKPRHQNVWIGMALLLGINAAFGQGTVMFNNGGVDGGAYAPPNLKTLVNTGESAFLPVSIGAGVPTMKVAQKVAQTAQFE